MPKYAVFLEDGLSVNVTKEQDSLPETELSKIIKDKVRAKLKRLVDSDDFNINWEPY